MKTFVIIPSAGLGKRFESKIPKQFLKINGIEILVHTLLKFQNAKAVDEIIISSHKDFVTRTEKLIKKYNLTKVKRIVIGGKERQDSVYAAFKTLDAKDNDLVCVHDAVRPVIKSSEIDELIDFAKKKKSVIAAKKAVDTIKVGKQFVEQTLDRNKIWIVQTPQIFVHKILRKAFDEAWRDNFYGTDEASIVERIGEKVYFYQVRSDNRKITLPEDLRITRFLLQ